MDRSILLATFGERGILLLCPCLRSTKRGSKCFKGSTLISFQLQKQENVEDESARVNFRALWSAVSLKSSAPFFFFFPFFIIIITLSCAAFEYSYVRWNGNEEESVRGNIDLALFLTRRETHWWKYFEFSNFSEITTWWIFFFFFASNVILNLISSCFIYRIVR